MNPKKELLGLRVTLKSEPPNGPCFGSELNPLRLLNRGLRKELLIRFLLIVLLYYAVLCPANLVLIIKAR